MKQWTLKTSLPVEFTIKNCPGVFDIGNKSVLESGSQGKGSRRLVVIDSKVSALYLKKIISYLNHHGISYHITILDAIERRKNIESLLFLLKEIERFGILRSSEPIIAIGGGVLLDIVGLAASLYRRGVPYIKVPTTLVGLVDASVGVKTAVNFEGRRNRLGAYYPPVAAYLDKTFLRTLEPVEVSSGLGEILKMGVIKDKKLFSLLQEEGKRLYKNKFNNCKHADEVIYISVKGMKEELENNLWEKELRRSMDFGHSFSPIIEMRALENKDVISLTHGQAVTLDIIFSCIISYTRNMLQRESVQQVIDVGRKMGLPAYHEYFGQPPILLESITDTIKHRNGNQYLPIPKTIGECAFINDLTYKEIKKVAELMDEWCNE